MTYNFAGKHTVRAGIMMSVGLFATSVFAVGPTVDQVTPSDAQRNAIYAAAGVAPAPVQSSPAVAFGSPIGFGLNYGAVAVGIGAQTLPPSAPDYLDGSMGVAAGFGNSTTSVGAEVTVNIISLRNSFAEDGSFNAKLHRSINPTTSVAIGAEGFGGWGAARNSRISTYGAITTVINAERGLPIVLNAGVGNKRFRGMSSNPGGVSGFASIAIVPTDRISFILDYTGVDTNAAISIVPVRSLPVTLTMGYVNLAEHDQSREFAAGLGYLYRF